MTPKKRKFEGYRERYYEGKPKAVIMRMVKKCLMCLKNFKSTGPGNRVCDCCKGTDAYRGG